MENEVLSALINNGVFGILFGYLLLYVLKQNQIREENYQKIIQNLNEFLPQIRDDLEEIKKKV